MQGSGDLRLDLSAAIESAPGVGPARARLLREAGIETLGDLLSTLPQHYEDRRSVSTVAAATRDRPDAVTLRVRISALVRRRTRRRGLTVVEGRLQDVTGSLRAVWFNRPYLPAQVAAGAPYLVHGRLRSTARGLELFNASLAPAETATEPGLTPVYGRRGDAAPSLIARLVRGVLGPGPEVPVSDPIPRERLAARGLPSLGAALYAVHRPPADADTGAYEGRESAAHQRLAYDELLLQQLRLAAGRRLHRARPKPHHYRVDDRVRAVARELLPFRLTTAQRRVLGELVADLRRPEPMLRLLQGDVGCGKTVVAGLLMAVAMESGLQAAFMAPTELLAEQHHATFRRLYRDRYRVELLTSSTGEPRLRQGIARGECDLVVGTHALIVEALDFARLGLVVIDEQHRFGVAQRRRLEEKGERPDVLVMTATPIPRSLAMTAYGDLDLSVIDELPAGRHPPSTHVLPATARERVFAAVERELEAGGQVYVVFPLIEESGGLAAEAVAGLGAEYRRRFAAHGAIEVTGQLTPEQRRSRMDAFVAGRRRVLIATTVIEVGVDVPDAACMVIESAERFGLAQLHQLRGRIGRGARRATCWAVHGDLTEGARERLRVFAETCDGFRIAEADLALRGPGELLGTRQAGRTELRIADPVRHATLLAAARDDARAMVEQQPAEALARLVGEAR
ncbi:MAG TPA: ATP-dependent DNA helicase RecG [Thermoanaerobaculia bacterium]|nr:ATP-dependent DNA helicase RecG [Thermoanaerobaculia bacterium]